MLYKKYIFTFTLILFFIMEGFAQTYNYEKQWRKVMSFKDKHLPKDAIKVIEEIYEHAESDRNADQKVKAIIYKINASQYQENAFVTNLQFLEKEIKKSDFPVKPVLQSLAGNLYWKYYVHERWRISKRTKVERNTTTDVTTWTLEDFIHQINLHYQNSISNKQKLQNTPLSIYSASLSIPVDKKDDKVFLENTRNRSLRPSLYDFIAHQAIDFWANAEAGITQPAYKFEMDKAVYFSPCQEFVNLQLPSKDISNFKFLALQTLQSLLKFHLKDSDKSALVDADLKRLKFVFDYSVHPKKSDLYLRSLQEIEKKYKSDAISADASFRIAQYYTKKASEYHFRHKPQYRDYYKKAMEICEQVVQRFPDTHGSENCEELMVSMRNTEFRLYANQFNIPDRPFLASIYFRNISQLHARVYRYDSQKFEALRYGQAHEYRESFLQKLYKQTPVKSWKVKIPDDNADFQSHRFEMKVPALKKGKYILILTKEREFHPKKSYAFTQFQMTNLSYAHRTDHNNNIEFRVLDRASGASVRGAKVSILRKNYNGGTRAYQTLKSGQTDADGYVRFASSKAVSRATFTKIEKGDDVLMATESHYFVSFAERKPQKFAQIFLDRGIYRPGQTVYFKTILLEKIGHKSKILPNRKVTVRFKDANYKEVKNIELISNEFGTIHGHFMIPVGRLNGSMSIHIDDYATTYFQVEEYKRPKFEVQFLPTKSLFQLNQSVKVSGQAQSYSGTNLDHVEVTYRVRRKTQIPDWFWGRMPSSSTEIAYGKVKTDEQGRFTITFDAIPDASIDKNAEPVFTYEISADVTDINGETHSAVKHLDIAYKSLIINTNLAENINLEALPKEGFVITSTNLEHQFEPTKGTWMLYRLDPPTRAFRTRNWDAPDLFAMSKNEFYATFPLDVYDHENEVRSWDKNLLRQLAFDTEKSKKMKLGKLKSGAYLLKIKAKDRDGETVQYMKYFTAFSPKNKKVPVPTFDFFQPIKTSGEPKEEATFLVGTSARNIKVLYEIELDNKIISKESVTLSEEQRQIKIPIKESYRGGFGVHWTFVKDNRKYIHDQFVNVPHTDKKLNIEFQTFRNKLLPGESETWNLKISGHHTDKVMAEVVTTMYDASLDTYKPNTFDVNVWTRNTFAQGWNAPQMFQYALGNTYNFRTRYASFENRTYDKLIDLQVYHRLAYAGRMAHDDDSASFEEEAEVVATNAQSVMMVERKESVDKKLPQNKSRELRGFLEKSPKRNVSNVKVRKNFSETAFFYPALRTDENGNLVIQFTVPESLTRWKILGLAHTKDLKLGIFKNELVTQKDLMVVPNAPRFFRENDALVFMAKVSNLSTKKLNGVAQIQFFDAITMQPVQGILLSSEKSQKNFHVKPKQSTLVSWKINIPDDRIDAITYRIVAKSGDFSDGEEKVLPILKNRKLVTETLPIWVHGNQSKTFDFKHLRESESTSLRHKSLTLEVTSNPAWYVVQALPYMMEYPYACAEQTFTRFYANAIASHLVSKTPKIKRIFDQWKRKDASALYSALEKNQDLKQSLLEETPWVMEAQNETDRKKRIALLFDYHRMSDELSKALQKLQKAQQQNGGFAWFDGMKTSTWVTQYIIAGLGHLDKMGLSGIHPTKKTNATISFHAQKVHDMVRKAIQYADMEIAQEYDRLKNASKTKKISMSDRRITNLNIQYLYARSFFREMKISKDHQKAFTYFLDQSNKYWKEFGNYQQGMIALALHRFKKSSKAKNIIKSLKQRAISSEEMGMYWDINRGYWWYQAPIETQVMMIEAFQEVVQDMESVDKMRLWLLKQKQTQDWKTTKATAQACYALLLNGSDWLSNDQMAVVTLGDHKIDPTKHESVEIEEGTGHYKWVWNKEQIKPSMSKVKFEKKGKGTAWGGVYWQYFEDLDKIKTAETSLKLNKKLFLQKNTDKGQVLEAITDQTLLKVGDVVRVRIVLRADRAMEYVHMKDMRAACFEPISTNSGYRWQDGLGYYESIKDASINFFFGYLRKGNYVFEYPLRVTHQGDFSNGVTTIQCMYAPEFSAHSQGVRVQVDK